MSRHKWTNTYFRGVETSSKQICVNCGIAKIPGCRFIATTYEVNGKIVYSPGPCNGSLKQPAKEAGDHANIPAEPGQD